MGHPRELPMVRVQYGKSDRMDSGGQPEISTNSFVRQVGADGISARYPARAYGCTSIEGVFLLKTNPGGTAGVDALVPEWTRVFLFFRQ